MACENITQLKRQKHHHKRVPLFACCFKEKHFVSCDDSSGDPLIFECECVNSTSHVRLNAVHRPENMMRDSQHSQTRCCSGGVGMKRGPKCRRRCSLIVSGKVEMLGKCRQNLRTLHVIILLLIIREALALNAVLSYFSGTLEGLFITCYPQSRGAFF